MVPNPPHVISTPLHSSLPSFMKRTNQRIVRKLYDKMISPANPKNFQRLYVVLLGNSLILLILVLFHEIAEVELPWDTGGINDWFVTYPSLPVLHGEEPSPPFLARKQFLQNAVERISHFPAVSPIFWKEKAAKMRNFSP